MLDLTSNFCEFLKIPFSIKSDHIVTVELNIKAGSEQDGVNQEIELLVYIRSYCRLVFGAIANLH